MPDTLNSYEEKLLAGWEDVHKKGQLTLWVLLALKDGQKHMGEIKQFILEATNGSLQVDDKSLYRALRRYADVELTRYETLPGDRGPSLKAYALTPTGEKVLDAFVRRNISTVFYKPEIRQLITIRNSDDD